MVCIISNIVQCAGSNIPIEINTSELISFQIKRFYLFKHSK